MLFCCHLVLLHLRRLLVIGVLRIGCMILLCTPWAFHITILNFSALLRHFVSRPVSLVCISSIVIGRKFQHNFEYLKVSSASLIVSWGLGFGQTFNVLRRRLNLSSVRGLEDKLSIVSLSLCHAVFFLLAFRHYFLICILTIHLCLESFIDMLFGWRVLSGDRSLGLLPVF